MKTLFKILMPMLFLAGCSKDKYQPKGDYQPAGNYGNATITTSGTYTPYNWTELFNDGTNFQLQAVISCSDITQSIRDNGVVMVYGLRNTNEWVALPFHDDYTGTSPHSTTLSFSFNTGIAIIDFSGFDVSGSYTVSDLNGLLTVRIVTISNARSIPSNIDLKQYSQVKKYFHVKD